MPSPTPRIFAQTRDRLGESPMWRAGEKAIYWVDLYGPILYRMRAGGPVESWTVPLRAFHSWCLVFVPSFWPFSTNLAGCHFFRTFHLFCLILIHFDHFHSCWLMFHHVTIFTIFINFIHFDSYGLIFHHLTIFTLSG